MHRQRLPEATTYRSVVLADVPSMARLREASGWEGGADAERMRRYLEGEHNPQHALRPRVAFVAEAAGDLLGFAAGHLTTRFGCTGELQWIVVTPAQRRRNVAAGLLRALAEWFAREGARRVCVNVAPDNERAQRFYARWGAEPLSPNWMVWPDIAAAVLRNRSGAGS